MTCRVNARPAAKLSIIGIVACPAEGGMVATTRQCGGMAMKVIVLKVRHRGNLDELDEATRRRRSALSEQYGRSTLAHLA
jgi:hypothetical protein